jgi:hypothetical protein
MRAPAVTPAAMKRRPHGRARGFAYLFALLVTALLAGAMLVTLDQSSLELAMARNRIDAARSQWVARGAVHQAAWRMRYDPAYRTAITQGTTPNMLFDPLLGGGVYNYNVTRADGINWLITGTGGAAGYGYVSHQLVADSLLTNVIAAPCIADAFIAEANPTANFGGATNLSLKVVSGGRQRLLLKFSLAGVPPFTNVQSAILELWMGSATGDETKQLDVRDLQVNWSEGTRTGSGLADGASWTNATSASGWKFPGADGNYGSDKGDIPSSTAPGLYRWDITNLVKDWLYGNRVNNGILIRAHNETENNPILEDRTFSSREDQGGTRKAMILVYY